MTFTGGCEPRNRSDSTVFSNWLWLDQVMNRL